MPSVALLSRERLERSITIQLLATALGKSELRHPASPHEFKMLSKKTNRSLQIGMPVGKNSVKLLGVDIGFSSKRPTTGIALLEGDRFIYPGRDNVGKPSVADSQRLSSFRCRG